MSYCSNTGGQGSDSQTSTTGGTVTSVTTQNTVVGAGIDDPQAVIISRQQQRRGLKQDLPQPLRPAELGFTTDSQQLFIGADPAGAPSFSRTSVFENTLNSRVLTENLAANQVLEFRMPFRKFSRGEFTGATQVVSWLPTDPYKTGADGTLAQNSQRSNVFSNIHTQSNNVFDQRDGIIGKNPFVATDLTVKKNSQVITGNNTGTYSTLVVDDYTFRTGNLASVAGNIAGDAPHSLILRTIPQPSDEITVSYYTVDVVRDRLEFGNGTFGVPGTFQGFYDQYGVPEWDKIDPDMITYSDTSGRGFIGLDFKHISVRAQGNVIPNMNVLTLGTLVLSRNSTTANTGNITRTDTSDPIIHIPVGVGHPFSNVGVRSSIVITDVGSPQSPAQLYAVGKQLEIVEANLLYVTADISVSGAAWRGTVGNVSTATANDIEFAVADTTGLAAGDTLYFYGAGSAALQAQTGVVQGVASGVVTVEVSPSTWTDVDTAPTPISDARFVNYGNISAGNVIQIRSDDHGLTFTNSAQVFVNSSTDAAVPSNANVAVDYVQSGQDWFYIPRTGNVTTDLSVTVIPDEPTDYGAGFSYLDDLLRIDLSGDSSVAEAIATVNGLDDWPLLQIVTNINNDQTVMLTQSSAYDSTGREFRIYGDPDNTAQALGLQPGLYTLNQHTRRAQLEKWLNDALVEPEMPVFTQVNKIGFGSQFYAEPADTSNLGTYDLDIDETFEEIRFESREEVIAFNTVLNNLYFRARNSDIRGLVNIKSNLEIELRRPFVVGDKITTFVDMNAGSISQLSGVREVVGMSFDTGEFNSYIIEYTVQEAAGVASAPGANYSRIGTMYMVYRRNFDGTGTPTVAFTEQGTEIADSSINVITGGTYNTQNPTLVFSAQVDPVDPNIVTIFSENLTGWPLTIKYIIRRWQSAE